jgi:hypothetical protein
MRHSRRLTGVLLVLALAGALAPSALAGRLRPPKPSVAPLSPTVVAPAPVTVSMVDIEALR